MRSRVKIKRAAGSAELGVLPWLGRRIASPMERDLTQGRFSDHMRALLPGAVGLQILFALFEVVDAFWVGRLAEPGPELAALAVGTYGLWCLFSLEHMVVTAVLAVVSQSVGAGMEERARRAAARGFVFAVILWIAALVVGLPLRDLVVAWTRVEPGAAELSRDYLGVLLGGALSIFGFGTVDAVFRARGDTKSPVLLLAGALVLNLVLDPVLVLGWGPFPEYGVVGAAWATVACRMATVVAGLVLLLRRGHVSFRPWGRMWLRSEYLRFLKIGAPAAGGGLLYCLTFLGLASFLAPFGDEALGAFAIGQKIESISWASLVGVATVAAAWVGQNLGAGHPMRARRGAWLAVGLGSALALVASGVFVFFREPLLEFFAPGQEVLHGYGRTYLWIVALSQVPLAVEIVLYEAFGGAGDTLPPMWIISIFTLARLPLAWWLCDRLGWGAEGVFWAVTISTTVKGVLMAWSFSRDRWILRGRGMLASIAAEE